jgi:hypothetical protein
VCNKSAVLIAQASMTRVIVYRSRATSACSDTDLYYLLAQAQERNELADVSGLLLYDRGYFFQWIEGAEDDLAPIWASIQVDARHRDVNVLADQEIAERKFKDWSMRFAHRDAQHANVVHGFLNVAADFLGRLHLDVQSVPRLIASLGRLE